MKRLWILLALALLLGCLAGCGPDTPKESPAAETADPTAKAEGQAPETEAPADEGQTPETEAPVPTEKSVGSAACSYTIRAVDMDSGKGIEGVVCNFCTDVSCSPVTTGEDGTAVFTGAPARYHVQVLKVPAGWVLSGESEFYTEAGEQSIQLLFTGAVR